MFPRFRLPHLVFECAGLAILLPCTHTNTQDDTPVLITDFLESNDFLFATSAAGKDSTAIGTRGADQSRMHCV